MKGTVRKLILISFVLALLAAGAIYMYLQSISTASANLESTRTIYVANETIPARTKIDAKMLKPVQVTNESIMNQYISETSSIIGKYAKETIYANEGFLSNKLVDQNQGEMSLRVPVGHRAVSINVSGSSGVSHLIKPMDRVDIVSFLNQSIAGQDVSKIVLQNITILAVDKQLDRQTRDDGTVPNSFLVTLSVPSQDVEKLVLAENIGNIKLVLRNVEDNNNSPSRLANWRDLTSQPASND